jgi:Ca2+-binding EF-hand superfamily protein
MHGIEPWPARALVNENLKRQAALARKHPLKEIPVEVGMRWFKDKVGGWFQHLDKQHFVDEATALMVHTRTRHTPQDRDLLRDIFDSMDFDRNGELSTGEWAGGLTVFFKGTPTECIHAVFDCLDTNGDRTLSKSELQEYLTPFVKAMTPAQADALRPLLSRRVCDILFQEMDLDHNDAIDSDEMTAWAMKPGNQIINRVATVIEHEVYSIWLSEQDKKHRIAYSNGQRDFYSGSPLDPSSGGYYRDDRNAPQFNQYNRCGTGYGGQPQGYGMPNTSSPSYDRQQRNGYGANSYFPKEPSKSSFVPDHHQDSIYGGGQQREYDFRQYAY